MIKDIFQHHFLRLLTQGTAEQHESLSLDLGLLGCDNRFDDHRSVRLGADVSRNEQKTSKLSVKQGEGWNSAKRSQPGRPWLFVFSSRTACTVDTQQEHEKSF